MFLKELQKEKKVKIFTTLLFLSICPLLLAQDTADTFGAVYRDSDNLNDLDQEIGYYNAQFFGEYNSGWNGYHLGEDWNGSQGGSGDINLPVRSVANGRVVYVHDTDAKNSWGKVVGLEYLLADGSREYGFYAHVKEILVSMDQDISKGQQIATIGDANGFYVGENICGADAAAGCAHLHYTHLRDDRMVGCVSPTESAAPCIGPGYFSGTAEEFEELKATTYRDPTEFMTLYNTGAFGKEPSSPQVLVPYGIISEFPECESVDGTMEPCFKWDTEDKNDHFSVMVNGNEIGGSFGTDYLIVSQVQVDAFAQSGKTWTWSVRARNQYGEAESDGGWFTFEGGPEQVIVVSNPRNVTTDSAQVLGFIRGVSLASFLRYAFEIRYSADTHSSQINGLVGSVKGAQVVEATRSRQVPEHGDINTVEALVEGLLPNTEYEVQLVVENSNTGEITYSENTITFTTSADLTDGFIDLSEASFEIADVTCAGVDLRMEIPPNVRKVEIFRDDPGTNRTPVYTTRETGRVAWVDMNSRPVGKAHSYDIVFSNRDDEQTIEDVESWTIDFHQCLSPSREIGLVADEVTCDGDQPVALLSWEAADLLGPMYIVTNITTGAEALVDTSLNGKHYLIADGLIYGEVREYQVSGSYNGEVITSNPVTVEVFTQVCSVPDGVGTSPRRFASWTEHARCVDGVVSLPIRWTESPNTESYIVERRRKDGLDTYEFRTVTSDLVFTDTGLQPGAAYTYKVTAVRGAVEYRLDFLHVLIPGDICSDEGVPESFDLYLERPICDVNGKAASAAHWDGPTSVAVDRYELFDGQALYYSGGFDEAMSGDTFSVRLGTFANVRIRAYSEVDPEKYNWSDPGIVYLSSDYCGAVSNAPEVYMYDNHTDGAAFVLGETSALLRTFVEPRNTDTTVTLFWGWDGIRENAVGPWEVSGTFGVPVAEVVTGLPCQRDIEFHVVAANSMYTTVSDIATFRTADCTTPQPPTIEITAPRSRDDYADPNFLIRWNDDDIDSDAAVTLSYTAEHGCTNLIPIITISENDPTNTYLWDTQNISDGLYYVHGFITDGVETDTSCAGPVRIEHGSVFVDEFNDGSVNDSLWTHVYGDVTETDGQIRLEQLLNVSEEAYVQSVPISITGDKLISIQRTYRVHHHEDTQSLNSTSRFRIHIGGYDDMTFGVAYSKWNTNLSNFERATTSMELFRNNVDITRDSSNGNTMDVGAVVWNEWVIERLVYDPVFGTLTVTTNNTLRGEYFVGVLPQDVSTLRVSLELRGHQAGHEHFIDRVRIIEEDRVESWELPGSLLVDHFDDDSIDLEVWAHQGIVSEHENAIHVAGLPDMISRLESQLIAVDPTRPIEIYWQGEFRTFPERSIITFEIEIDGSTLPPFGLLQSNYHYTYDADDRVISFECVGTRLFKHPLDIRRCHEHFNMTPALSFVDAYNMLEYDPVFGDARLYVNGQMVGDMHVGAWDSSSDNFRIAISVMGEEENQLPSLRIDNLVVRQPELVVPIVPEPDPATIIMADDFEWGLGRWVIGNDGS